MKTLQILLLSLVMLVSANADKINEPAEITVTTTSTVISDPNTERVDMVVQNTGSTDCSLVRQRTAVSGRGVLLKAGGVYIIDSTNLYRGALAAITASGTTTIRISERSK